MKIMNKQLDFSQIKLVVSDIDGTLLREGEQAFSDDVWQWIHRLHEKGILFSLATGRLPYEVDPLLDKASLSIPYAAGNGAIVRRGNDILEEHLFIPNGLQEISHHYSQYGVTVIFTLENQERPLKITPWSLANERKFPGMHQIIDEDIWETPICRMFFYHPEGKYLAACRETLAAYEDRFTICFQNEQSIQISAPNCTKATGVQSLASALSIPIERVLCIGNADNDVSMLLTAGVGAAVSNASSSAKAAAAYVSEQPFSDGVSEILQAIYNAQN